LKIENYFPLTNREMDIEGRWMAKEDLNIYLFVKEFGTAG